MLVSADAWQASQCKTIRTKPLAHDLFLSLRKKAVQAFLHSVPCNLRALNYYQSSCVVQNLGTTIKRCRQNYISKLPRESWLQLPLTNESSKVLIHMFNKTADQI